jgi:trk system potassium uptake protein TrkA
LTREILLFDSFDETIDKLIDILTENGYTVHVLTLPYRADHFTDRPVYIHVVEQSDLEEISEDADVSDFLRDIDFYNIEIVLLLSHNEDLNLKLARIIKKSGVPRVIIVVRSDEKSVEAEKENIQTINLSHCVLGRIQRILSLKFVRLTPIRGEIFMLESLVTGDMKIIGEKIGDLEDKYNIGITLLRGVDEIRNSEDEIIQEGDYLIAIGHRESLMELIK